MAKKKKAVRQNYHPLTGSVPAFSPPSYFEREIEYVNRGIRFARRDLKGTERRQALSKLRGDLRKAKAGLRKAKKQTAAAKKNPGKLRKVNTTTGWLKADAVRFVKKRGRTEVYIRRNKPRKKAKGKK